MPRIPRPVIATLATILAVSLGACGAVDPDAAASPASRTPAPPTASLEPSAGPTAVAAPAATPLASAALLDTDAWVKYTSDRYGFTLRHPADWVPETADHDWTLDEAVDFGSSGHERFRSAGEDVGVSVWAFDPGPGVTLATTDEIVAWAADFCGRSVETPCGGIAKRAVPLCFGLRDCHPAVLVPFMDDTYAFIPGLSEDGMIVAAVWRPEDHPSVQPYGGATALLLTYLSTLNVDGTTGVFPAASPAP